MHHQSPGLNTLALYRAEKAAALTRWADYVLAVVEGHKQKVVSLGRVS
jgi:hypothetical protein